MSVQWKNFTRYFCPLFSRLYQGQQRQKNKSWQSLLVLVSLGYDITAFEWSINNNHFALALLWQVFNLGLFDNSFSVYGFIRRLIHQTETKSCVSCALMPPTGTVCVSVWKISSHSIRAIVLV